MLHCLSLISKLHFLYTCSGLLLLIVFPVEKKNAWLLSSLQEFFIPLQIVMMSFTGFLLVILKNPWVLQSFFMLHFLDNSCFSLGCFHFVFYRELDRVSFKFLLLPCKGERLSQVALTTCPFPQHILTFAIFTTAWHQWLMLSLAPTSMPSPIQTIFQLVFYICS